MKATRKQRSGFSDYEHPTENVRILGFVHATIEPGYMRSGSKACIVAVVATEDGRLSTAELCELKLSDTQG